MSKALTDFKASRFSCSGGRRSNVVKEVEKLRRNREERRVKQAEIMEEKVAMKNVDPGNANWEFLAMIRDYREQVDFNPLQDGDAMIDHQVCRLSLQVL